MSSNIIFILLVMFNLLAIHYAYRINPPNSEPIQGLFPTNEENANNEERLINSFNIKSLEEFNVDANHLIPCYEISSSYILCKKLNQFSRRDTGFLRFGRKR